MIGNVLEWYDFSIYGFFALQIGKTFFQTGDQVSETLAAFGVFAAGFLTRPLGSVIFGHIGDRYGRTTALTVSIVGMAVTTVAMGLLPGHASIGLAAPVLLTVLRLLQGIAAGGEAAIAGVFMIENAPPGRRALSGAIGGAGTGLGVQAASFAAFALAANLTPQELLDWGWRVPFLFGLVAGIGGFWVRYELLGMPDLASRIPTTPIVEVFRHHLPLLIRIMALACFTVVGFQAAFIYIAQWLQTVDGISPAHAYKINSLSMLLTTPVSLLCGWLADLWGRRTLMMFGAALGVVGAVPFFWLMHHDSLAMIYLGQAGFVVAIGIQFGVMHALMVESTPADIRCTALAVGNNIVWTALGSATPLVATWLVYRTHDNLSPAYLIVAAAAITFAALFVTKENFKREI